MANTAMLSYSVITQTNSRNAVPRTPTRAKRRTWRRATTVIVGVNRQKSISSPSFVQNVPCIISSPPSALPDIVNDCHIRRQLSSEPLSVRRALQFTEMDDVTLTCKQIAHSLRFVADQVDRKYCQDAEFERNFRCLSVRLVLQTSYIRTILCTLWTRSLVPFFLIFCKTRPFFMYH